MVVEKLLARNLMTRDVQTVGNRSSLADAVAIMDKGGYDQIPVMDGEKPVALLTDDDARRAYMENRQNKPIMELASRLPALLKPTTPLSDIQTLLQEQESLLIISDSGRLMGIITYWDVLQLARPFLVVTELELLLREVTIRAYQAKYGPDWWGQVPADTRRQAEQEHERDKEVEPDDPEHMLSHTSMWSLIEAFRAVLPGFPDQKYAELQAVRRWRNNVAHHAALDPGQVEKLVTDCVKARDWLQEVRRNLLCKK